MVAVNYDWDELEDNIDEEYDDGGVAVAEYTTEPEQFGNVISQRRSGQNSFFHFDALGSTLALTDASQQLTDTYAYSAFGEVTESFGNSGVLFQYEGRSESYLAIHTETYESRERTYSPVMARFLGTQAIEERGSASEYTLVAFRSDEDYCEGILEKLWAIWKWTHPCAAAMLRGFLFGKPDRCPDVCATKLRERGLDFVKGCIESKVSGGRFGSLFGGGFGTCGLTSRHKFSLFGCHDFQGPPLKLRFDPYPGKRAIGYEGDLGLAFGCIRWHADVSCLVACGPRDPQCCCACNTRCGFDFTLLDRYDFCSTVPPGTPKYHPLSCACLLEKKGRGRVYDVKCSMTIRGEPSDAISHRWCGEGPKAFNPLCPHTRSAPAGVPIRPSICEGCEHWYQ